MLRQVLSLVSNFKNWIHGKERQLEKEETGSDKYTWPGPDQWYQGPLEVFTQSEEGPSYYETDQET